MVQIFSFVVQCSWYTCRYVCPNFFGQALDRDLSNTFTFFYLTSYSYFQRTGETSFEYDQASNKLTLKANIGITDAKAGYDARAEFQGISVGASADAKISKVNIYFDAEMCLGEGCKLILKDFQISEIGHIDVSIHGLGPLDWILGI